MKENILIKLLGRYGFNKTERIIIFIIIIVFISFTVMKFVSVISKFDEDATKAGLKSLRMAIAMYYAENEGQYPDDNIKDELIKNNYLKEIPYNYIDGRSNKIIVSGFDNPQNSGGWAYKAPDNSEDENNEKPIGSIWINTSKKDSERNNWSDL